MPASWRLLAAFARFHLFIISSRANSASRTAMRFAPAPREQLSAMSVFSTTGMALGVHASGRNALSRLCTTSFGSFPSVRKATACGPVRRTQKRRHAPLKILGHHPCASAAARISSSPLPFRFHACTRRRRRRETRRACPFPAWSWVLTDLSGGGGVRGSPFSTHIPVGSPLPRQHACTRPSAPVVPHVA